MTTEKSTIERESYSHPIEPEIVGEVAEQQGVNELYLHQILQRMQDFWEPTRDLLESVAYRLYNHSEIDTYPDRSGESEYTVFRGEHLTPSDVFARIEKDGSLLRHVRTSSRMGNRSRDSTSKASRRDRNRSRTTSTRGQISAFSLTFS